MDLAQLVSANPYVLFVIFAVVVVLLYKMFKTGLKALMAGAAGFAFPWIAQYAGLPMTPTVNVALQWALLAIALFLAYAFFHTIIAVLKAITWPFRKLLGGKKE